MEKTLNCAGFGEQIVQEIEWDCAMLLDVVTNKKVLVEP